MACAMASRSLALSTGGELTRNASQNTVRFGVLTSCRLRVASDATEAACAGSTVITSRSPFLYFVNAAAPSLTIANEIRVSVGLAPQ